MRFTVLDGVHYQSELDEHGNLVEKRYTRGQEFESDIDMEKLDGGGNPTKFRRLPEPSVPAVHRYED